MLIQLYNAVASMAPFPSHPLRTSPTSFSVISLHESKLADKV